MSTFVPGQLVRVAHRAQVLKVSRYIEVKGRNPGVVLETLDDPNCTTVAWPENLILIECRTGLRDRRTTQRRVDRGLRGEVTPARRFRGQDPDKPVDTGRRVSRVQDRRKS